jgi:hypothetical protein
MGGDHGDRGCGRRRSRKPVDLRHGPVRRSDLTSFSGRRGDRLAALPVVPSRLGQRSGAANHRPKIFRVYRFAPDHKLINLQAANA